MPQTYEPPAPDYRIDGFEAATARIDDDFTSATLTDDLFVPLSEHHSADGRDSYLLFYDRTAIWDIPGTAEYVTLHITRDVEQRTFDFASERHPVAPLAQNWLIRRGCPKEAAVSNHHGPRPADALTARLEDLLRTNPGHRYEVLDHYTENPCSFDFGVEVRTLVYDSHPDSADTPYRLFLEETTKDLHSYIVREGIFASAEEADTWVMERNSPLPLAPDPSGAVGRRAAAARARSTVTGNGLAVAPAPVSPPPSAGGPAPTRFRGGTR
ncbi:hypothetical protein ACM01_13935 [Streptomyces viridochromogenes]|uniref:Uncharacterized protein n=1 Tax=Streptomyces viridochromogenes TaxID=1938 RepID=A0A0J7ZE48_STRVR|nr:hypothetical protein [Streptomyces viridochromogenes]KMS74391.1 hypothetical protein ACM01_13935 [Streptomyces viridochromogenes]